MDKYIDYGRIDLLTGLIFVLCFFALVLVLDRFGIFKKAKEYILPSEHAAYLDLVRQLFEKSINAMIVIDSEGRVILWSPRAEYKFEWTAKEALGRKIDDLIIPERFREAHRTNFYMFLETHKSSVVGNKFGVEVDVQTKTGRIIPIRLWLSEIGVDGVTKIAGFIADRTEELKKFTEYQLRIKNLECSEKIAGIGYWYWDLIGKDVWVSKNFREVFNIDDDEVTSDLLMELVYPEDREKTARVINEAMVEKRDYEVVYRRPLKDGGISEIKCNGVLVLGEYGEVKIIHGIIQRIKDD